MKHYVNLLPTQGTQAVMDDFLTKMPNIKGFIKRYHWNVLEPEQNKYDFATLALDLSYAKAKGVALIPMVVDKTFDSSGGVDPAPAYARALPNQTGGYSVARWTPYASEGFQNLHRILVARFPDLGGIAIQETAPGLTSLQLQTTEYTPDKYIEHYRKLIAACSGLDVYFHFNYIPQGQGRVEEIVKVPEYLRNNVIFGGPDCVPASVSLQMRAYPHYYKHAGPKFIVMSSQSYQSTEVSIEETYRFAEETLEVESVFWTIINAHLPAIQTIVARG